MTKTTRLMTALVLMAATKGIGRPAAAQATNRTSLARVRSTSPALDALIARAAQQSHTFRGLIEAIYASDGIVYVEAGQCGDYVRSCLVGVSTAGGFACSG